MLQQASSASSTHSENKADPSRSPANEQGMVLLAVDEPSVGRMLVRVMSQAGLKVFWVRDLAQGLASLRSFHREVSLAFLDCHQSETESRVFCRCARNILPGLPVMLAGGEESKSVVDDLAVEGLSTFVPKPYLPTELTWQLRAHLQRKAV
jgi:DNA-binding response OmpR family regulator